MTDYNFNYEQARAEARHLAQLRADLDEYSPYLGIVPVESLRAAHAQQERDMRMQEILDDYPNAASALHVMLWVLGIAATPSVEEFVRARNTVCFWAGILLWAWLTYAILDGFLS